MREHCPSVGNDHGERVEYDKQIVTKTFVTIDGEIWEVICRNSSGGCGTPYPTSDP
jgi:hypothetical protein